MAPKLPAAPNAARPATPAHNHALAGGTLPAAGGSEIWSFRACGQISDKVFCFHNLGSAF